MSEKEEPFARRLTKALFGGFSAGWFMYLGTLFFKISINTIAGATVIPDGVEVGALAFGFAGAGSYVLSK